MKVIRFAALIVLSVVSTLSIADEHQRPAFISGEIIKHSYDGVSDDLLTAGLGAGGLQSLTPPGFANASSPTSAELRRRAIYQNYRALVDVTPVGGFGTLYGPQVGVSGDGKIAGDEYLAYDDPGSGRENVTMMVQVPVTFNPGHACIVTAPSSGSRGVYGAIGTAGEWGLKHGCAVAYTDKGTGNGAHDLQNDTVNLIDGVRATAAAAGKRSNFTADLSAAQRNAFNAATPNRFAFKHAHSQLNPEKDWGEDVLHAIRFAFFVLNEQFSERDRHGHIKRPAVTRDNTIVIASSVSNGGGASIAAAELDRDDWIDGVAVSEPTVQIDVPHRLRIQRGGQNVPSFGKPLYDYFTIANLYQPCAAYAPTNAASPGLAFVNALRAANRCEALKASGLISGATLVEQTNAALAKLRAAGWEPESDLFHASHYGLAVPAVTVTYANAYGRFSVVENVCGFSFGATDATGLPIPAPAINVARIFGDGNGVPPTNGINIINNLSVGGPILDGLSISASTNKQDLNFDGAACLRELFTGEDLATRHDLRGQSAAMSRKVQRGIEQVLRSGDLNGKPAIIVQGRSDTLLPVNHNARPYYGTNQLVEGRHSNLQYYEVTNAQHFDAFIDNPALPGYDSRLVPLHYYFNQAMDLMFDHLKHRSPLPPSQVVRTVPRGGTPGAAPAITAANVPPIKNAPAASDLILFGGGTLRIPE
jgi:hydroxybutyrate-dimer hydrolase